MFERCVDPVFSILSRYTKSDRSSAQDLTQKVMIRMFQNLDQIGPPYNLVGWACSIAHHAGLDHLRELRRERDGLQQYVQTFPAESDSPEDELIRRREFELVRAALAAEPNAEVRQSGSLFYEQEMSIREIAQAQGVSETAVTTRLSRFRARLRKRLLEQVLEK